jgi:hypothetical protein
MKLLLTFGGISDKHEKKVALMYLSLMICSWQGLTFILANQFSYIKFNEF